MTTDLWIWIDNDGHLVDVHPVPGAGEGYETEDGEWVEGWYPEQPGERPPQRYEMTWLSTPTRPAEFHTVYPLEPWSAYDAITDELLSRGWLATKP